MSAHEVTASETAQPREYAWSAHPASERPGATIAVALIILAVMVVLSFESFWWSFFAACTFFFTLNRYFLPTRFVVNEEGIEAAYPLRRLTMTWAEVRRTTLNERGGHLSARRRASAFDGVSGIHIMFGPHADAVLARSLIRAFVGAAREARLAERSQDKSSKSKSDRRGQAEGVPA